MVSRNSPRAAAGCRWIGAAAAVCFCSPGFCADLSSAGRSGWPVPLACTGDDRSTEFICTLVGDAAAARTSEDSAESAVACCSWSSVEWLSSRIEVALFSNRVAPLSIAASLIPAGVTAHESSTRPSATNRVKALRSPPREHLRRAVMDGTDSSVASSPAASVMSAIGSASPGSSPARRRIS